MIRFIKSPFSLFGMNANVSFTEIWEKLRGARKVLLSLHFGPDGDSLGSCSAMKYVLEKELGIEVDVVSKDNLDEVLGALPYAEGITFGRDVSDYNWDDYDYVMALDSGAKKQFMPEHFDIAAIDKLISIDHHATNDYWCGINYVETLPSCCSVLLKMFRELNVEIDDELATRLLLGIYTDTRGFVHSDTVLSDAAYLISQGANYLDGIVNPITFNVPLRIKKYYALCVDRLKTEPVDSHVVGGSSVTLEEVEKLGLNLSEARGSVNDLMTISGIDVLFTLIDMGDFIKGSFRSRKGYDVSLFAKELDGGGHKAAAAFKLLDMSLDEARVRVIETIAKVGFIEA
ncbi:MAG: phosphoesterase RecJ-like protein [Patescibacteria group bacterium]